MTVPPSTAPMARTALSQGMLSACHSTQATRLPSGESAGWAKNPVPSATTRTAAGSSAAEPSTGISTIARRCGAAERSSRTASRRPSCTRSPP